MTSRLISEIAAEPAAPLSSPDGDARAAAPQSATPEADTPRTATPGSNTPHVASPPTSPWWTAPAGKPVDIPAFGRAMIDALLAMLSPAPRPHPIRVRTRR